MAFKSKRMKELLKECFELTSLDNFKPEFFADNQEEQLGEFVSEIDEEYKEAIWEGHVEECKEEREESEEDNNPAPYIPIVEEHGMEDNRGEDPPEPEVPRFAPAEDFDMRSHSSPPQDPEALEKLDLMLCIFHANDPNWESFEERHSRIGVFVGFGVFVLCWP
eukprot:jgi/Psemu1/39771/gm1.39771_g